MILGVMVSELTAGRMGTGGIGTLLLEGARGAVVVLVVFSIVLLGYFVDARHGKRSTVVVLQEFWVPQLASVKI